MFRVITKSFIKNPYYLSLLIVSVLLPSSFFNFVPKNVWLDLNFLLFTISMILVLSGFKNRIILRRYLHSTWIIEILLIYVLVNFIISIGIRDIYWLEALKVFRNKFFWPLFVYGLLLHLAGLRSYRIGEFLNVIYSTSISLACIYLIVNLIGIDIYANSYKEWYRYNDKLIIQNLEAIPIYLIYLLPLVMTRYLLNRSSLYIVQIAIIIFVYGVSMLRGELFVILFTLAIYIWLIQKKVNTEYRKLIAGFLLRIFFSACLVSLLFWNHVGRLIEKFGVLESSVEGGSMAIRLRMIAESWSRITDANNVLLGNGYIRNPLFGKYDLTFTLDTYIAPVLVTEGLLGLALRILVLLGLILDAKRFYIVSNNGWLYVCINAMIWPQILNIIQTSSFVNYSGLYLLGALLILYEAKEHKNFYSNSQLQSG